MKHVDNLYSFLVEYIVPRPKPLSAIVTQSKMKSMTVASLFDNMLEKVKELGATEEQM